MTLSGRHGPSPKFPATAHAALPGLAWPALPSQHGTSLLALLYQLEFSQWWAPEQLRRHQFKQMVPLLEHAFQHVPYYRERREAWGIDARWNLTPESFAARVPIITRAEVQEAGTSFHSEAVPKAHGPAGDTFTSGSTGRPLKTLKTGLTEMMWQALTLRESLWHRDLSKKLAIIKIFEGTYTPYPDGDILESWGGFAAETFETGPCCMLHLSTKTHEQIEWLQRMEPDYLFTFAGNAQALAQFCLREKVEFPALKQLITFSDLLRPEARAVCDEAWGVPIVDVYSSAEAGYLALQCPDSGNYHIQSEAVYVEVVNEAGQICAPGEVGEIIVTPLHNFAMPLLRYASGDLAEVGVCGCGRGLPALKRILGRTRAVMNLPNGESVFPNFQDLLIDLPLVQQFQVRRQERDSLDVKLVVLKKLTESEAALLQREFQERFQYPFRINITYHDELVRSSSGKFHDFRDDYHAGGGHGG